MGLLRDVATRSAFELSWATRITAFARTASSARGAIFALGRVLPDLPADFSPNADRQITPEFLETLIQRARRLGYDIVDIDEAVTRIEADYAVRKFVVFTFDGAWRDLLQHALPVLRRHQCPFTIYVATALVDGVGEVGELALEELIARQKGLAVEEGGEASIVPTATLGEKRAAYDQLIARMRALPEPDRIALLHDLARKYDFDLAAHCRALVMDWTELRQFAGDQLCTIGAGTVHGYELSKLPAEQARREMALCLKVLEAQFGRPPLHLSYPVGTPIAAGPREYEMAAGLGLRSAVTTIPGALHRADRARLLSLPRIPISGRYQAKRHADVYAAPSLVSRLVG